MSLFHIPLLEGAAPLVLIGGWMRQLKNRSFCLGKTHWKVRHGCCCNYLLRGRSVIFFSVIARLQLNSGLFLMFLSMTCSENLLNQICLIDPSRCAAVSFIVSRHVCAFSFFPLFYFKNVFFCGKILTTWLFFRMACFAASFVSLRFIGKNSVSAQFFRNPNKMLLDGWN